MADPAIPDNISQAPTDDLQNPVPSTSSRRPAMSSTERSRRYRARKKISESLTRESNGQVATNDNLNSVPSTSSRGLAISSTERSRRHRQNNSANLHQMSIHERDPTLISIWQRSTKYFESQMSSNPFGYVCDVCDRIWYKNDIRDIRQRHSAVLEPLFGPRSQAFKVCGTCFKDLDKNRIPLLSTSNGFKYPERPQNLPELNPVAERLISPRLPFMQIRRLRSFRSDGQYSIKGQVINVPVNVNNMVRQLPRRLDDDYAINVSIKRRLIYKSVYLSGQVKKSVLKSWLDYLIGTPLYRRLKISVDWTNFDSYKPDQARINEDSSNPGILEGESERHTDVDSLITRQHTLLWSEANTLEIAPGQNQTPLNIIFDEFAEELSFPKIYYGHARNFKPGIGATPYKIANSEIRRRDRRGVSPDHILYMAMKILRLRVVDRIYATFKCVAQTENLTARMIADRNFLEDCIERNLAFLKSIPNSAHYWQSRKKDLFAMIRQLGKPTCFLTLSANEINWPNLLNLLQKFRFDLETSELAKDFEDLSRDEKADLINADPIICCIYFHKIVLVIMTMIKAKRSHNPFSKYRVIDSFMRIEFQHRGSPHAHILLWLDNDPKEPVGPNMPRTIKMMTDLLSVSREDLGDRYNNQVHKHTFTCTKRGEEFCRFNIPYWPIEETCVIQPMSKSDGRLVGYRQRARKLKANLRTIEYSSIECFLAENHLNYQTYLEIIKAEARRTFIAFKRDMSEINTNTFHPWIASIMNSNTDFQIILDEFSCASYVVDYVNKSSRGNSNLHRKLIELSQADPTLTQEKLIKKIGSSVLDSVEISAQEAAWFLLRQPMSVCSREVAYIPTCKPNERHKSLKRRSKLDKLDLGSKDVWTKTLIQRYEDRPECMNHICLADFVAWFSHGGKTEGCDQQIDDDNSEHDDENVRESEEHVTIREVDSNSKVDYRKRDSPRVIRYRNYEVGDSVNYKREMVTLYLPFKKELVDVLDCQKFMQIYDERIEDITRKRQEYEALSNFDQMMQDYRQLNKNRHNERIELENERQNLVRMIPTVDDTNNNDDFEMRSISSISVVKVRADVLSSEDYCRLMRKTNSKQRELILEVIHRLHSFNAKPLQFFFTGPAGCGKTFTLKLIMETLNRFTADKNNVGNAFLACASTGKAAINLGGTTVHSAFQLCMATRSKNLQPETLQDFRTAFKSVNCVIIDEISMLSSSVFHNIDSRLKTILMDHETNFGGMNVIFCGDFKQLPPVRASPVYKGNRDHLAGGLLWQQLEYFSLDQVMRQNDVTFSSILTKIGHGHPLSESEGLTIENRFRTEEWCNENLPNVVRLYFSNDNVNNFNQKALRKSSERVIDCVATDTFSKYRNSSELISAKTEFYGMALAQTGNLPHLLLLSIGYPYMMTSNTDISDCLVNGCIGILKYVELRPLDATERADQVTLPYSRVWLEFSDPNIGSQARLRHRSSISDSRGVISRKWTPIGLRSANVRLQKGISARRTQFPLTPACAMTIHKSQGGTFEAAVVEYQRSHPTQLVYVALSRVTSIDGLYLVNRANDKTFYHKFGSDCETMREINDEYERLKHHPLKTITREIRDYVTKIDGSLELIICTINAQSLVAHAEDIETDECISLADILCITETWMDPSAVIALRGYDLVTSSYFDSCTRPVDNSNNERRQRVAGGVAIYKKKSETITCSMSDSRLRSTGDCTGDAVIVDVRMGFDRTASLCTIYIHPSASKQRIELFLTDTLNRFIIDEEDPRGQEILIVTGDFNIQIAKEQWLANFMRDKFGLRFVSNASPTTLSKSIIDLTFVRGVIASCKPFVGYFSYHLPLFNKLKFE